MPTKNREQSRRRHFVGGRLPFFSFLLFFFSLLSPIFLSLPKKKKRNRVFFIFLATFSMTGATLWRFSQHQKEAAAE